MRRSREDKAETHRRIVDAAARLFRARGIAAVSVADVMDAVDMTVGGFYRHFDSKEDLVAAAIERASIDSTARGAMQPPAARVAAYLSMDHRDHPEGGCPIAALCSDIGREGPRTKKAFTAALARMLEGIATAVPGETRTAREKRLAIAATLVGAVTLARSTSDRALAEELLAAARRSLT